MIKYIDLFFPLDYVLLIYSSLWTMFFLWCELMAEHVCYK